MRAAVVTWFGNHHRLILRATTLAVMASLVVLYRPGLHEEYSIASFVGGHNPRFDEFQDFIATFGGSELTVFAVRSPDALAPPALQCVQLIASQTRNLAGVQRVSSIADLPALLRRQAVNHPLISGTLISKDARTAAVILQMADDSDNPQLRRHTVQALRDIAANARQTHPQFEIILTGPYVTMLQMFEYVRQDLALFSVFVIILMFTVLYVLIGQWQYCLFIVGVGAASTLCTLGVTIALQLNMSLTMQMVVTMISVLAVANCVHLAVAHRESAHQLAECGDDDRSRCARETLMRMLLPCTAVMLTSAAGFGAVIISDLKPIELFGYIMAGGLLLSLPIAFAGVYRLPPAYSRAHPRQRLYGWLERALERMVRTCSARKSPVVLLFVAAAVLLTLPIPSLKFESSFVNNFRQSSDVRRGYHFVEQHLAPMNAFDLIVRRKDGATVVTPQAVRHCQDVGQAAVREHEPLKQALSIADVLLTLNPNLPDSAEDLQLRLTAARRLFESTMGTDALNFFMTPDQRALHISLRIREAPSVQEKISICRQVHEHAQAVFGPEYDVQLTGLYYFYATLIAGLLREQNVAFGISVVLIFLMMCIFLRDWKLAALAMIPNLLPMLACLGLMGYLRIPVNMATSMMLSIALGIAIDDTIHYIWRYRRERGDGYLPIDALARTHRSVGQACVFTTLVIAGGFWILCFSRFLPTAYFGALVGLTMLAALAADLLLLPVLLLMLERKPRATSAETL